MRTTRTGSWSCATSSRGVRWPRFTVSAVNGPPGAVDERRLAAAEERTAEQVEPRRRRDAPFVHDRSLAVQHGHFEPRVLRPVARAPDDRADGSRTQRKEQRRVARDGRGGEPL